MSADFEQGQAYPAIYPATSLRPGPAVYPMGGGFWQRVRTRVIPSAASFVGVVSTSLGIARAWIRVYYPNRNVDVDF